MNTKKLTTLTGIILLATVLVTALVITPPIADAAVIPHLPINIKGLALVSLEKHLTEHDTTAPISTQQESLDDIAVISSLVETFAHEPKYADTATPLLEQTRLILERGIVAEDTVIHDEHGNEIFRLSGDGTQFTYPLGDWTCRSTINWIVTCTFLDWRSTD